jgi:hypothetical protein
MGGRPNKLHGSALLARGLSGSSFTKDFAIRYLVYAFGVRMKLMHSLGHDRQDRLQCPARPCPGSNGRN